MKIKVNGALSKINTAASYVNAANFTWEMGKKVLKWLHLGKEHHSIELNDAQWQHYQSGGTLECHYDCGTILRTD